jgi:hypothetical protein
MTVTTQNSLITSPYSLFKANGGSDKDWSDSRYMEWEARFSDYEESLKLS